MCTVGDLGALLKERLCCHRLHATGVQGVLIVSQKLLLAPALHLALRSVRLKIRRVLLISVPHLCLVPLPSVSVGHLCGLCWCAEWVGKGTNCLTFAVSAALVFLSLPP